MMMPSCEMQVCSTLNLPGFAQLMSSDHTPCKDEEVAQQQHQKETADQEVAYV